MAGVRVLLSFNRENDLKLADFSEKVGQAMKDNAFFASPPVTMEALETATAQFREAVAVKAQSGPLGFINRGVRRETLLKMLRKLANYVQQACDDDLGILATSGFSPVIQRTTRSAVAVPAIMAVTQGPSTQLLVRVKAVPNAKSYEARFRAGAEEWQLSGAFSDSRRIVVANLKPGTSYTIQVRSVGGINHVSDWSNGVTQMVI